MAFGEFFDSLLGKGGPSPNATYGEQLGALKSGKRKAIGSFREGLTGAEGVIAPYSEGGLRGQELYDASLGLRGQPAQREAFGVFQDDPSRAYFDEATASDLNRVFKSYNDRGNGLGGLAMRAVAREGLGFRRRDYEGWQNRLAGRGGQGLDLAKYGAGLKYDTGTRIGDTEFGYGQQKAGLMGHRDNALRAQSQQGINNLLGLGGLAIKAGGMAMGIPPMAMGGGSAPSGDYGRYGNSWQYAIT